MDFCKTILLSGLTWTLIKIIITVKAGLTLDQYYVKCSWILGAQYTIFNNNISSFEAMFGRKIKIIVCFIPERRKKNRLGYCLEETGDHEKE